jgi:hypothetical protein
MSPIPLIHPRPYSSITERPFVAPCSCFQSIRRVASSRVSVHCCFFRILYPMCCILLRRCVRCCSFKAVIHSCRHCICFHFLAICNRNFCYACPKPILDPSLPDIPTRLFSRVLKGTFTRCPGLFPSINFS